MAEIRDFPVAGGLSDTAANGAWPEGMSYSAVNDSGRENQNILGRWYKNTNGSLVSTGTWGIHLGYAAYQVRHHV